MSIWKFPTMHATRPNYSAESVRPFVHFIFLHCSCARLRLNWQFFKNLPTSEPTPSDLSWDSNGFNSGRFAIMIARVDSLIWRKQRGCENTEAFFLYFRSRPNITVLVHNYRRSRLLLSLVVLAANSSGEWCDSIPLSLIPNISSLIQDMYIIMQIVIIMPSASAFIR